MYHRHQSQAKWKKPLVGLVVVLLVLIFVWNIFSVERPHLTGIVFSTDPKKFEYATYEDLKKGEIYEEPLPVISDINAYNESNPRYLAIMHGFGPNNQYLGLKDVMYMAKLTGRTLVRPDFWTHAIGGLHSIRSFESTFDVDEISKYLPTISMKEFKKVCGGTIDTVLWSREDSKWRWAFKLWTEHVNMTVKAEHKEKEIKHLSTPKVIRDYYKPYQNQKCLVWTTPFRNVAETPERKSTAKYLVRAPSIRDFAKKVYEEMGVTSLLSIHWRWGEDSCGWWTSPTPHEDWQFCWGTSIFHFAHMDNVFKALANIIREKQVSTVYIAVSSMYNDPKVLELFKQFMNDQGVKLFIGSESLKILRNVTDNYYLSLIEQEICANSKTFIWSSDSTWSDFIVNQNDQLKGPLETISFANLLKSYDMPYTTWNRVNDVPTLNKFKRPRDSWWREPKKN